MTSPPVDFSISAAKRLPLRSILSFSRFWAVNPSVFGKTGTHSACLSFFSSGKKEVMRSFLRRSPGNSPETGISRFPACQFKEAHANHVARHEVDAPSAIMKDALNAPAVCSAVDACQIFLSLDLAGIAGRSGFYLTGRFFRDQ
jgi:hypothetical protein